MLFDDLVLAHGDQPYDPVAAHEYYLRTRELQGRDPANPDLKTAGQKKQFKEAKAVRTDQRRAGSKKIAEQRKAQAAQLRANGQARAEQIRAKLQALLDKIDAGTKAESERIGQAADQKISQLPEMPSGLSEAQQADWKRKRAKDVAKIRGQALIDKNKASKFGEGAKKGAHAGASDEKKKLAAEMKMKVAAARQNFQKLSDGLKAKSQSDLSKDAEAIRSGR